MHAGRWDQRFAAYFRDGLRRLRNRRSASLRRGAPLLLLAGVAALILVLLPALVIAHVATDSSADSPSANASASFPVTYTDAQLRFSLHLPSGWTALSEPYVHSRGTEAGERNAVVSLRDAAHPADRYEVAVTESPAMVAAFSRLGTPNTHVGRYPALTRDISVDPSDPASVASGPCLVRIFLAQTSQRADYVVAQACGPDIAAQAGQFQAWLATYLPAAPKTGAAIAVDLAGQRLAAASTPTVASQPQTCAELVAGASQHPDDTSNWGRELASATDPRWSPYPSPGASVCSDFYYVNGKLVSYDGYLFQCVELANRFLREQWGHGGVNGNAAQWFDYSLNGTRHDGRARLYPDAQLSDDASQGISAFKPGPGDILVWQDVQDGKSWLSGLTNSPGHVAVITGTDANNVYFMQQNYSERRYYMSLPLTKVAAGWKITDTVSGVPGRIVRGWIHFTENNGSAVAKPTPPAPAPTLSFTNTQDVYTIGTDGQLYNYRVLAGTTAPSSPQRVSVAPAQSGTSGGTQSGTPTASPKDPSLTGTPSLNLYQLDGQSLQSVYAAGSDGHLYEYVRSATGWSRNDLTALAPLPAGVHVAGSPAALTYSLPGLSLLRHVVYVGASDGKLYRYVWTEGGAWQTPTAIPSTVAAALGTPTALSWTQTPATSATTTPTTSTASTTAPAATASPSATTPAATQTVSAPVITRYEAIYVIRADGHLYEYLSADGANWQQTDLSAQASPSPASPPILADAPSAYTFTPAGAQNAQRAIFALGADGHLFHYSLASSSSSGTSWSMLDVSTAAADGPKLKAEGSTDTALTLVGSPSAVYAPAIEQPSKTSHEAYALGSDGHLYEYFYTDAWHGADVSAATGSAASEQLSGTPLAFSFALHGDQDARRSIYAVTTSGTLAELSFAPQTGSSQAAGTASAWSFVDHGALTGLTFASSSLAGAAWTQ